LLLKTKGDLEASVTDLKRQIGRAEAQWKDAERSKIDACQRAEQAEIKQKNAEQLAKLFEGEVLRNRDLLKSYDAEFSIGRPDAAAILAKKDQVIANIRTELDECRAEAMLLSSKVTDTEERFNAGVLEINELRRTRDKLREQLFGLQHATGMDFVPGKTRVLHLTQNPASAAIASASSSSSSAAMQRLQGPPVSTVPLEELKRLRVENKRLTEALAEAASQVQAMSNNSGEGGHGLDISTSGSRPSTFPSSSSSSSAAQQTSKSSRSGDGGSGGGGGGADSSKLNQRMKETFRERITSFREAVYLLTGYKVDLLFSEHGSSSHPRLRLRSMFAENPDDSLLFQWKGEVLELLQTPFAETLNPMLLDYIQKRNSVPAFLSAVSLELFDNQTLLG